MFGIKKIEDKIKNFISNLLIKLFDTFYSFFSGSENSKKFILDKNHIPSINIIEISTINPNSEDPEKSPEELSSRKYIYNLRDFLKLTLEHMYLKQDEDQEECQEKYQEELLNNYENVINEYANDKIFVEFSLNNDVYFMCINNLKNFKKNEHIKKSHISRRIISATLLGNKNENEDVLSLINKYHGPDYNFYSNLSGVSNKFSDIFVDYELSEYKTLVIDDLFGDTHIYDIHLKDHIDWRTHPSF
jgi:hypothetical protein